MLIDYSVRLRRPSRSVGIYLHSSFSMQSATLFERWASRTLLCLRGRACRCEQFGRNPYYLTSCSAHDVAEARQRFEQYLTFSQSRAHFLRHAKGLPQHAQCLVGKSSLRRILGMALPGYGVAAPIEEAAVAFNSESIDDLK